MTDDDKTAFSDALTALGIASGQQVSTAMRDVYWQFLRDLDRGYFLRAVGTAGRTLKFFPKPAELREFAGAGEKAAVLIAWDAVRAAMRRHGYTRSVDFGPLVNATIRNMGGWQVLDGWETEKLEIWGKKEFERVYLLLATQPAHTLNGAPLGGAFGGAPALIAIPGHAPPRTLPAAETLVPIVRQLAEAKAG